MGLSDCIFEPTELDEEFVDALYDSTQNNICDINDNDDWFDPYDLSCRGLANDFFIADCERNNN